MMKGTMARRALVFFFQAEDGIRDCLSDWSSDVCSSDLFCSLHPLRELRGPGRFLISFMPVLLRVGYELWYGTRRKNRFPQLPPYQHSLGTRDFPEPDAARL